MDDDRTRLRKGAGALGVHLIERDCKLLLKHLDMVLLANRTMNLTAPISREEAIMRHTIDSLALLPILNEGISRLLDLGAGAGFPGIPIAAVGDFKVYLLEAQHKKAVFLNKVLIELGIAANTQVLESRAEEIALAKPSFFDVVTARAVTSLPALVELAAPLLRRGGSLLAMKGRPSDEELEQGAGAAEVTGMREGKRHAYELPAGGGRRVIVVYEKVSDPQIRLPRRVGLAQKRPLA